MFTELGELQGQAKLVLLSLSVKRNRFASN